MAHILVAEPTPKEVPAIREAFGEANHHVTPAHSGDDAWQALGAGRFELVVLSLQVEGCRATELLRRIRRSQTLARLPVIVRCHQPDEIDRVLAFELGADDLIEADASLRELTLRVGAVLRRSTRRKQRKPGPIELGSLEFRPGTRELIANGSRQRLTPVESRLLCTLLEQPDRVWRREDLIRRVWAQVELDRRTVDSQVRRLRGKLGEAAHLLETVRGVGYRLRIAQSSQSPPD